MTNYDELAHSVVISSKNRLVDCDPALQLAGTGRSAFVFKVRSTDKAMKVFFPDSAYIAKEEAEIYASLMGIHYFPDLHGGGVNYIVMDYIEGETLFHCLTHGKVITEQHIEEIDRALALAAAAGLNPSDIHLRNILITPDDEIKLIDVARYRQQKDCRQWNDLKKAHRQLYQRRLFSRKVPEPLLNAVAFFYKKGWIPSYRLP